MANPLGKALTWAGTLTARPGAFLLFLVYAVLWIMFDRESLNWHSVATLATWAMTLVIQRAEHRDTQALQAKIDELLHAEHRVSNRTTQLDQKEPEEIESFREQHRAEDGAAIK